MTALKTLEKTGRKPRTRRIGSAALTDAAYGLIAAEGLDSLTFRKLARRAGCSLGTLTYHFASREDVISAVLSDKILPFMRQGALLPHHPDPVTAFLKTVQQTLPYDRQALDFWRVRLELMGFAAQNPVFRVKCRQAAEKRRNYLEKLFSRLKSLKKIPEDTDTSKLADQTIQFETGAALSMLQAKEIDRVTVGDAFLDWLKSIFDLG